MPLQKNENSVKTCSSQFKKCRYMLEHKSCGKLLIISKETDLLS